MSLVLCDPHMCVSWARGWRPGVWVDSPHVTTLEHDVYSKTGPHFALASAALRGAYEIAGVRCIKSSVMCREGYCKPKATASVNSSMATAEHLRPRAVQEYDRSLTARVMQGQAWREGLCSNARK